MVGSSACTIVYPLDPFTEGSCAFPPLLADPAYPWRPVSVTVAVAVCAVRRLFEAYTQARRGELTDAEASARATLSAVDRDPAILHLPLTSTVADASKRILESAAGESARKASGSLVTGPSARKVTAAVTDHVTAREKVMEHLGPPTAFGRADAGAGTIDVTPRRPTQVKALPE